MKKNRVSTRQLVESALLLTIGLILSSIFKFKIVPTGGSITIASMLPIILLAYKYGPAWGSLVGFAHAMLQILEGGLYSPPINSFFYYLLTFLLDYALAWTSVGLLAGVVSKILKDKKPQLIIVAASIAGIFGRFICNSLSGAIVWNINTAVGENALLLSMATNATVLLPEMIITSVIGATIISFPVIQKELRKN